MQNLKNSSRLPSYMAYPRYLLALEINPIAKMVYVVLLDRGRLSIRNKGWEDERGDIFIYYPIADLANVLNVSEMTIKRALKELEHKEMIHRVRQGAGKANRIYVRIPANGQNSIAPMVGTKVSNQIEHRCAGNNKQYRCNYTIDDYKDDGGMSL